MPKGIRPTQNKVRKAIFDILGDIDGFSFLELFAGSGAVGLEALSQRAKQVVFVEKDARCISIIKENLGILDARFWILDKKLVSSIQYPVSLLQMNASDGVKLLANSKTTFDIAFADPPYYKDTGKKTLQTLGAYDILAPNGLVVLQHYRKDILPPTIAKLARFKEAKYGDTALSFYRKE